MNSDGDTLINEKNIEKEAKIYKALKSKMNLKSFEKYSDYMSRFWQINFFEDELLWRTKNYCNCGGFQKRYICRHILLQAIRFEYVQVPLTAQTVEDMPKRGRPSTVSKALPIDTNKRKTTTSNATKNAKKQKT